MSARQMISFGTPGQRFNFRAAGIALRDDHVLVHRAQWDAHWSLPGGRVEMGEESAVALAREVEEELGVTGEIGALRFVMENFFVHEGVAFHALGFYYALTLPERFPFRTDGELCHRCADGEARLEFKWVPAAPESLDAIDFQPATLRELLLAQGHGPLHFTHKEMTR